ncbi:glycoside hydrolase family 19 protein [Flavobacterium lacisediminis]|uniref:Glycoside hydrolase family 19 catalytic domain-containing protein n=1 Tax=Flavobacterium lacisediminis TaxID=2989705 RepID=A0ABT3EF48_9FLAO|nr:hypothetical protein [Flavobacterium lacisediminis]MCW1147198.1 hypothetical protein [Flavobacterium lacisediminis]
MNETCSTYDDGENDEVISDDSAIGGDNTSGGSGTVGTDPIYSDPLCPTCPEFSDKDCNITVEQLQQLFPNSTADIRNKLAEMINEVANDFGIDTKNEICHFLAQTGAETGGFITLNATEGLNYTSANRLLIVYPSKFSLTDPSLANPNNYLNNPQALANYVYCCKYGNGNEASGDGWRYRGRGIVQLTWKSNYDAYVNFLNNIGLGWSYSNPDIIESDYRHSIVSGMWFFKQNVLDKMEINDATTSNSVTKKVNRYAPKDTKIIRQNYLNSAKNIINCQ